MPRTRSGMYVRLGFAVAAHINPNVLLVDEVLAVGDAAFQSKCQQRIEELRRGGMTIAFVSHDMTAVERLCERVVFLQNGEIRSDGEPQKVISDYYNAVVFKSAEQENEMMVAAGAEAISGREAEILGVKFLDRDGLEIDALATGQPLVAQIEYRANRPIDDPVFELFFYSADDRLHTHYTTALTGDQIPKLEGHGVVEIEVDEFGLTPGIFKIDASLMRRGAIAPYDWKPRQYLLKVLPGKKVRGMFYSPHRWRLVPLGEAQAKPTATDQHEFL